MWPFWSKELWHNLGRGFIEFCKGGAARHRSWPMEGLKQPMATRPSDGQRRPLKRRRLQINQCFAPIGKRHWYMLTIIKQLTDGINQDNPLIKMGISKIGFLTRKLSDDLEDDWHTSHLPKRTPHPSIHSAKVPRPAASLVEARWVSWQRGKASTLNLPFGDGSYHPFVLILGMVAHYFRKAMQKKTHQYFFMVYIHAYTAHVW